MGGGAITAGITTASTIFILLKKAIVIIPKVEKKITPKEIQALRKIILDDLHPNLIMIHYDYQRRMGELKEKLEHSKYMDCYRAEVDFNEYRDEINCSLEEFLKALQKLKAFFEKERKDFIDTFNKFNDLAGTFEGHAAREVIDYLHSVIRYFEVPYLAYNCHTYTYFETIEEVLNQQMHVVGVEPFNEGDFFPDIFYQVTSRFLQQFESIEKNFKKLEKTKGFMLKKTKKK